MLYPSHFFKEEQLGCFNVIIRSLRLMSPIMPCFNNGASSYLSPKCHRCLHYQQREYKLPQVELIIRMAEAISSYHVPTWASKGDRSIYTSVHFSIHRMIAGSQRYRATAGMVPNISPCSYVLTPYIPAWRELWVRVILMVLWSQKHQYPRTSIHYLPNGKKMNTNRALQTRKYPWKSIATAHSLCISSTPFLFDASNRPHPFLVFLLASWHTAHVLTYLVFSFLPTYRHQRVRHPAPPPPSPHGVLLDSLAR